MILEKLIAEAWEQERERYAISGVGAGQHELTLRAAFNNANGGPPIAEGSYGHCEAHLSALCAKAVMKMLANLPEQVTKTIYDWSSSVDDFEGKQRMFTAIFED